MKKVIVWGTGSRMRKNRDLFFYMEILYYCNNEIKTEPQYIDGIEVVNPEDIFNIIKEFPDVRIIIASVSEKDIYEQCLREGIGDYVDRNYIDKNKYSIDRNICYTYGEDDLRYCAGLYDDVLYETYNWEKIKETITGNCGGSYNKYLKKYIKVPETEDKFF